MRIHYVKSMWDDAKLWKEVFQTEKWTLRMADGTFKEADTLPISLRLFFDGLALGCEFQPRVGLL
ncbi:hypothetical protein NE555_17490, partial [Alistipes onderdonkii]|nr:hypothetical protein [Alistipes onderdonkii]